MAVEKVLSLVGCRCMLYVLQDILRNFVLFFLSCAWSRGTMAVPCGCVVVPPDITHGKILLKGAGCCQRRFRLTKHPDAIFDISDGRHTAHGLCICSPKLNISSECCIFRCLTAIALGCAFLSDFDCMLVPHLIFFATAIACSFTTYSLWIFPT